MAGSTLESDTVQKINRVNQLSSEFIAQLANEPSIGLYHIQEHVHRAHPKMVSVKKELQQRNVEVEEALYDLELSLRAVKTLPHIHSFNNIQTYISDSLQSLRAISTMSQANFKAVMSPPHIRKTEDVLSGESQPMAAGEGQSHSKSTSASTASTRLRSSSNTTSRTVHTPAALSPSEDEPFAPKSFS